MSAYRASAARAGRPWSTHVVALGPIGRRNEFANVGCKSCNLMPDFHGGFRSLSWPLGALSELGGILAHRSESPVNEILIFIGNSVTSWLDCGWFAAFPGQWASSVLLWFPGNSEATPGLRKSAGKARSPSLQKDDLQHGTPIHRIR